MSNRGGNYAYWTDEAKAEMRSLAKDGKTINEICALMGKTRASIKCMGRKSGVAFAKGYIKNTGGKGKARRFETSSLMRTPEETLLIEGDDVTAAKIALGDNLQQKHNEGYFYKGARVDIFAIMQLAGQETKNRNDPRRWL
jgi:hypothetical protein